MPLWLAIFLAAHAAISLGILALLIVQEATLDEPDWRSFWAPVVGSLLWLPILMLCTFLAFSTAFGSAVTTDPLPKRD